MGAQGIRRRKRRRDLPNVENIPPGDVRRLFGRFTWGAYSPAGALERNGFFWRQLRRRRTRDKWKILGYAWWYLCTVPFALVLVLGFVHLFR